MGFTEYLIAFLGLVASGVLSYFLGGRSAEVKLKSKQSKASLDAENKRRALDEDIDQDPDLADRARRSGIVRDVKPE